MRWLYPILNVLQALFLAVWSVFWISLALVLTILTFNRNVPLAMARRFWAPALIWATGCRFKVDALPNVDWSKPHIFVMNHQSMLDIPCAFAALPVNIRFVAKQVLKYVPFLGWYMWLTGMIFVDRSNRTKALRSLALAGARIRGGANILAYPEGTRSRDGAILPFKKGPFVLALEAGVPIIPVAIEGSGRVLPSDGFRIRAGEVRLKIGMPIETAGRSPQQRDDLLREVRDAIISLSRDLGGPGGDAEAIAAVGVEGRA
jgi:1-acyl-sn-glycerol-3-phosphate acyltransferase